MTVCSLQSYQNHRIPAVCLLAEVRPDFKAATNIAVLTSDSKSGNVSRPQSEASDSFVAVAVNAALNVVSCQNFEFTGMAARPRVRLQVPSPSPPPNIRTSRS